MALVVVVVVDTASGFVSYVNPKREEGRRTQPESNRHDRLLSRGRGEAASPFDLNQYFASPPLDLY